MTARRKGLLFAAAALVLALLCELLVFNLKAVSSLGRQWTPLPELQYSGDFAQGEKLRLEYTGLEQQLDWGHRFNVNVIRVVRGKKHLNMPSGSAELKAGDKLLVIGRSEDLRALRLSLGLGEASEPVTLRAFTESQPC